MAKTWQGIDIHNVLDNSKPNLIFSPSEMKIGNEYLKKMMSKLIITFV